LKIRSSIDQSLEVFAVKNNKIILPYNKNIYKKNNLILFFIIKTNEFHKKKNISASRTKPTDFAIGKIIVSS
jgi:hypothetical protein